ncbi:hypothetical protein N7478_002630 [Penicillium angulare]|uniref:uncharacterized protein n=1 Tax=Penicillium angulare TaxID=116970 RepID=UPI0025415EF4|nr:uncharacterized protein N7478_002630 [Penicillium angulare]KAJ5286944.1 hypothetical protein N7478_002630 [Penicillium angulare]
MEKPSQFPFLDSHGAVRASNACPVDTDGPSLELVAWIWARLLSSITVDQSPVFLLNGSVIKVDLFARSIHPANCQTLSVIPGIPTKFTAVVVGDYSPNTLDSTSLLTWFVNPTAQTSILHSTTDMGTATVHQMNNRLTNLIQEQTKSGLQVELSVSELPAMSVSNPSPCILPGSQLLHELALGGSYDPSDSNHAVEFLAADGNICCLSYRSLDQLSSKLAAKIAQAAAQTNATGKMVVPVLLPQSLELYITWLAVLKAGGAFCPLNTDAPPERIEFILQDVAASVMITQGTLATRVPRNVSVTVINTDGILETVDEDEKYQEEGQRATNPYLYSEILPSNLAYVMYTSGSTGRPKGVGISHRAATQSLLAHNDLIPPFNRFLQFASPTFDVSVFEVFFPFMRRATLIGSDREQMLLDISHVMTEMRVDAAELTPTVAGELLRTRAAAPSLRVLLTIGEMLTKHVVEEFGGTAHSDGILHGMYGPTEAAIHCTAATHFQSSSVVNLIGKPFKTVSAFIMSLEPEDKSIPHELETIPMGEIGELVVGGPQLADGYINRPEENAKAFIESPLYGRLYRTGDKARMLPSGEIECFGRISSGQVKLRGQRLELGEIEHVILRAPKVRSAVVIVSGGSLAAFVLASDEGIGDRELRDICRQWLPRFMVPGEFIILNQFPQLPSGKVDRKALEAQFAHRRSATSSTGQQPFRDEVEETISSCVSDVLDKQLSSIESLVSGGLDSLAAIRLASHLLDAGIRLDVAQLLDADSVDGIWKLAKEMEETKPTEDTQAGLHRLRQLVSDAGSAKINALGLSSQVVNIEPSTHIQQAMILETVRHARAYCNWVELEFQSSIGSIAIEKAFKKLLERNSLLRSGFVEVGLKDQTYARFTWKVLDEWKIQRRHEFSYDLSLVTEHDLLHPFQIQFKEKKENLRVLVHIHHALYDGWSWQLILKDLHCILKGEETPPKPGYNIVTDFFIEHKLSGAADSSSLFWRDQLQDMPTSALPNFHGHIDTTSGTCEVIDVLDISVPKLHDFSQRLMVSRQTIFQAAFCYILSTYLGSDDIVFGTVFSGRTLPVKGIEVVLGPCIRTLPTRMKLDKMQNVADLLLAIQNMNRKSLEHGSLPLQEIKKSSGIDLHESLFETAIVWQESIWTNDTNSAHFKEVSTAEFLEFALLLEFEPREDRIHAKATYQNSIFPREQIQILLEQIDMVASIIIDSPMLPLHEVGAHLPLSTLSISNQNPETHKYRSSLVTGVETTALVEPTRQAIEILIQTNEETVSPRLQTLSYGQLNSRANRLAHYLIQQGLTRYHLAAVFLDKSIDSYISMLAVAKIGAGLLPITSQTFSQVLGSIRTSVDIQPWIIRPSTSHYGALNSSHSFSQIFLPVNFDDYSDENLLTTHDSFYMVCADDTPANKDLATCAYLSHHSLQSHINVLKESYPTAVGSKLLQAAPSPLNASIMESFLAWHMGITLCLASTEDMTKRPTYVINTMNATHLHLTPTLAGRLKPDDVPSVRYLLISGEKMTAQVRQSWSGAGLHHGYETFGLAGICTLSSDVKHSTSLGNIGKPLENTSVMLLSDKDSFTLVPRGATGELCFGGDQVARVFPVHRDQSFGNFVEHPHLGRIYRSGEYGRLLPDGSILLVPALDQGSVKTHSTTFEEIDHAVISSKFVEDTKTMILRNPLTARQQPVTIWIPSSTTEGFPNSTDLALISQDLFTELDQRLAPYSMPTLLVPMQNMPMTQFFKTDYDQIQEYIEHMSLEELESFSLERDENTDGEFTNVEKIIAGALAAVIEVDIQNINKNTSFYKLGLDSLSAISFSRKLQELECGRIAVSTILHHSSVSQLGHVITLGTDSNQPRPNGPQASSLTIFDEEFIIDIKKNVAADQNSSVQDVYPCTPLQEAMLAADSDTSSAYFNHLLLRVNTKVEALKSVWAHMLLRHDILRTCFKPTYDKRSAFAQIVLSEAALPWSDVETSSHNFNQDVAKTKSEFEHQSPVNGKLPYSLTAFADSATHETHLLLSIHHALYDGEGISNLLRDIQLVLNGDELPTPTPFGAFVKYTASVSADQSDKFWDRYLAGASPTLLSSSQKLQDSDRAFASSQVHVNIKDSLTSFKQKCKQISVTPLNVFHAAWARLLSLHSDSSDVCFGNVFSCRTVLLEGVESIVGPCFNTLPMRVKLPSTATNSDILKLSQKNNSHVLPHQLSSLRRIQRRALNGHSRLFDTLVIFQSSDNELDPRCWELVEDEGNMGFPLICEIIPHENRDNISVCLHFHTSVLTPATVELLSQDFLALIEHTLQYPSAQASDRAIVGAGSPQIFELNGPSLPESVHRSIADSQIARPWSYQEEALRDIICKFSAVDEDTVSLHTTIFQLGLDSIHAVQIAGQLRSLGFGISAGDILEAASIDKIASFLESNGKEDKNVEFDFSSFEDQHLHSVCENYGLATQTVQALRPCTPVQNGMLALFTHSHGNTYFNHMRLKFSKPLDRALLKEAWIKVMDQHDMLRTGFIQLSNQQYPFAMITYQKGLDIPWNETSKASADVPATHEQAVLKNLHQPPWQVIVESSDTVDTLHFSGLHALYDAQSLESIFSDVMAVYEGKKLIKPSPIEATLGPLLIESQKQMQSTQEYWQGLATDMHPSKFPDMHPLRTENPKLISSSVRSSTSLQDLEARCRDLGVTLQAAGQAAWTRLLTAYTGERNVTFGTVLSGRNLSAAAQHAVFPCLVTLPSPHNMEGSNLELLQRTLKRNAPLIKNQFTPLAQIQRWLGSDEPLFDTLFVYQKFTNQSNETKHWQIIDEDTRIDYPVSIELVPSLADLEIRISYRSDILPQAQALTLLDQYDKLLKHTLSSPDSSADDYLFLENKLLSITPAKEKTLPSPVSLLHQFVEENAVKIPGKIAFEFAYGADSDSLQKHTWSYQQFNEDGNRVAHFLQAKGATPRGLVAICFDKCPEASVAILGILKAGCAYLAIDPSAPISRKQFIMDDSQSKILLCNFARKAELEGLNNVIIEAMDEPDKLKEFSYESPLLSREIQPDDTCYCLYTSGTTGTPKGCEITHDNAVQAMLAFQRLFSPHWDEDSRWLQFASFHFDVSVLEQYWSWSVGICVTSCPRDLLFEDLPGTIQKLQVTHIDLTPSLARLVHPNEVPSLTRGVFITGGEALKQEILDDWGKHGVIYNGYGPTEVTIGCTMLPRMRSNDKASNIGPQFDNVGSYVFRPGTSTPVLRGGIGELCVSGPLVGKGYLNRAELTKERFQYLPEYEDRIYRTGDLVRILFDGSFQFLGRIDDQVKLRGQRLEIGEINEVIKQATPGVNEVATLVVKHPKQSKDQLVSFVTRVNDSDKRSNAVEIRAFADDGATLSTVKAACHAHLPGYMVPTHIIPLTSVPLSANNKADMKILKSLYQELSLEEIQSLTAMTTIQATKTAQEEKLIAVLTKFLGSTELAISSWSSIYELGLDSISVIAFSRSLREAGFSQAQPSLIMKYPTIGAMASALEASTESSNSQRKLHRNAKRAIQAFAHKHSHSFIQYLGLTGPEVQHIAPCTALQEGIIYHFLSSTKPMYCSSFTFDLDSNIDLDKLRASWEQAQSQIQMLRARFLSSPDGYAQVILKHDALPWFQSKVISEGDIEIVQKEKQQLWIFKLNDLSTNLWEVGVITSPEKSIMCLNIFHALYDGNSLGLLLNMVKDIYHGHSMIPDNISHFSDMLHLGPLCKDPKAELFWKDHLANCQFKPLPGLEENQGTSFVQKSRISTTDTLDHLKKSLGVSDQAILHACWLLTLQRHYNYVPALGIIVSGRTIDVPGIEEVVGPLFNTLPSNVQLRGLKSWADAARRCHEYHVSTMQFQYTPLRDIVKWLGRNPDEPLFDSLFVFQRENVDDDDESTSTLWEPIDSEAEHEYPLAFEVVRHNTKGLALTLATKDHAMSSQMAQEILSSFEQVLTEFAKTPEHEMPYLNGVMEASPGEDIGEPKVKGTSHHLENGCSFEWGPEACTIRDAIASLAGVDGASVSEETSIFEVGLDSIDAIKLSSRLSKLGVKVPVSVIMRSRNIKSMVGNMAISDHHEQNGAASMLGELEQALTESLKRENLMPVDACRVLPATPIQEGMIAEMLSSGYQHYYNQEVLKIEPHVNLKELQGAWIAVVKAHPILRTSFVEVSDPQIVASYAQVIHDENAFDFQTLHLDATIMSSVIERQRGRASTELKGRPLLTVTICVDGNDRYLILSISHALYDGWSINLLHEDVARSYNGEACTRPSSDIILEQILASSGEQAVNFWRTSLSNLTPAAFPPGPHSQTDSDEVHRAEAALSVSFKEADAFCKRHDVTMQALMVACWSLVLATHVKELDVVFGLVFSGRNVAESNNIMFPTMNTVAMRVILHGTRLDLVKYVQEIILETSEYQHFPLRRARPDNSSRPLFDTLFIYQKRPSEAGRNAQNLYNSTGDGAADVEYPVCAEIEGVGEDLIGRVACRASVLGKDDTMELLGHIAHVLTSIIDDSSRETIGFTDDHMSICGRPVSRDSSSQGTDSIELRSRSSSTNWSPMESNIRSVLSVVSGVPENMIDQASNIFELGLDSISAIKVAALLKKQSIKLTVSDMLKAGSITNMAKVMDTHHVDLTQKEVTSALQQSISGIQVNSLLESHGVDTEHIQMVMPTTAGQTYFLAMHSLNPEVFYPQFFYFSSKQLSRDILNDAWSLLTDQTPILRTAFIPTDSLRLPYIQAVFDTVHNPVCWHEDLDTQATAANIERKFGSVPVELHACQTNRGTALTLKIHHALYDAISLPAMMDEFSQICNKEQFELKYRPRDISQLVAIQHVRSPENVRRQFWQTYLGETATREFEKQPVGEFGAIQQHYRPGLVSNMSRAETAAKLQGLSIQSIFLAMYSRVHVQTFGNAEELVIGLYLANRSYVTEGLSELVAPTVNIVPLRLDNNISGDRGSLFAAARKIQDDINLINTIEHAGISLVEIAEWTGVRINTCINFLRLPEMENPIDTGAPQVAFRAMQQEELENLNGSKLSKIAPSLTHGDTAVLSSDTHVIRAAASTAAMKNVFWPTIDVEAAIRKDRLDFGLFGPNARLDHDTASQMIANMQQEMGVLLDSLL